MSAQPKDVATATTAIAEYNPIVAVLAELTQKHKGVVFDVTQPSGLAAAKAAAKDIGQYRIALEKKRKDLKEDVLVRGRLIDGEAKKIADQLAALEDPIVDQIKAEERRVEAERQAAIEAEQRRLAEEERARKEAEEKRLAAERKRIDEERAALERKKLEEELASKRAAEEAAAKKRAEEEAARRAKEEAERKEREAKEAAERAEREKREAEERERRRAAQELEDARATIAKHNLVAVPQDLWTEILEFIEGQVDVKDGSYGEQTPNTAMSLSTRIEAARLSK